jgi:hypothetical protein
VAPIARPHAGAGVTPKNHHIMSSKDYAKEYGMSTAQKIVPLPYVIALIALVLVGGYFAFSASLKAHAAVETPGQVASK